MKGHDRNAAGSGGTSLRSPRTLGLSDVITARHWGVGVVRIALLVVVGFGAYAMGAVDHTSLEYLAVFYGFGLCAALWHLISLRRGSAAGVLFNWAQILADFGVVAATVSFTGGPTSFFTFLFVIVILEGGLLLGPAHGFVFATMSTAVLLVQSLFLPPVFSPFAEGELASTPSSIYLAYNGVIQALAFYLTASISGFWNQRVRRMQQFQREILDNMNNGFLITDRQGVITAQNKAADAVLMLSEGSAIGLPVQEILRVEPEGECPVMTSLRTHRDFTRYEFHARTVTGRVILLGLSTSHFYDWRGRFTGIIASFTDLTELEEMRREVQRQDRLAVVGELAAGLAHEIRNPVAAIRGAVDELQGNLEAPPVAERLARIAVREADHLNRIVTDFLDFAREPQLARETLDVREVVREVAEALRLGGDAPGLTIETRIPEACACGEAEPFLVLGDRSQLRQVFTNLGRNAIEAMQEIGRERGTVTISVVAAPGSVEVVFDDEGPGIAPDKVARIFEPFYTTKQRGVGMGLAVCQRIITAHDGVIRAVSRETGGASMRVRLATARTRE